MEKDLSTQELLCQPDVFADISNAHLFKGKRVICPEDLERLPEQMTSRSASGMLQRCISDIRMRYKKAGVNIAIIHVENQTGICNTMPIRDLGYIFSSYNEQIKELKRENRRKGKRCYTKEIGDEQRLLPVITLILYYGKQPWEKPLTIMDLVNVTEKYKQILEPFILNHRIHVVQLQKQDSNMIDKYHSDFWHVANYLASCGNKNKQKLFLRDNTRKIVHREELLDVMHALSGDDRYQEIRGAVQAMKGEMTMCVIAEELEKQGMRKGVKKGVDKMNQLILHLAEDGRTDEIVLSAKDIVLQKRLMEEYGI